MKIQILETTEECSHENNYHQSQVTTSNTK